MKKWWKLGPSREAVEALAQSEEHLASAAVIKEEAVEVAGQLRRIEERNHLVEAIGFQFRGGRTA